MEVIVLDVVNPPVGPVLSIQAGTTRRQTKLEVNQPFALPNSSGCSGQVQVTLYQQLASQSLPNEAKPEAVCCIPVRRPDGGNTEVKLKLTKSPGKPAAGEEHARAAAEQYLKTHGVQGHIQGLIQDVLKEQPKDPFRYMVQQLRRKRGEDLNPVPPAGKPAGGRPQIAGRSLVPAEQGKAQPPSSYKRNEAQQLAHSVLKLVLRAPRFEAQATASLLAETQKETSSRLAESIVGRATLRVGNQASSKAESRGQAYVVIRMVLEKAAVLTSWQYQRNMARMVVRSSILAAAGSAVPKR